MFYKNFTPKIFSSSESLHRLGSARQQSLGVTINLLVWNIYKARKKEWEKDFNRFAKDKDLILLQEAILKSPYDSLFDKSDHYEWLMAKSYTDRKTLYETGVKTGCVAKSTAQAFYASPDVEPFLNTPKMALATAYEIQGCYQPLLVLNVHAINFVSFAKYSRHMAQIMEAVRHHAGPVILAGDFNTWSGQRHLELRQVAQKLDLSELNLSRKGRVTHLNQPLDHVFFRGLEPLNAQCVSTKSSDHDPIEAIFKIL